MMVKPLLILLLALPGLAAADSATAPAIRPLDDPANPFREHYSAVDHWFDAYLRQGICPASSLLEGKEFSAVYPETAFTLGTEGFVATGAAGDFVSVYVDEQGFLVPFGRRGWLSSSSVTPREAMRIYLAQWSQLLEPLDTACRVPVDAIPEPIMQEIRWFTLFRDLLHIPRIPAWLGTLAPVSAVFMDNGEILCEGELGLRYRPYDSKDQGRRPNWYRYAPDGRLLGVLPGDRQDDPRLDSFSCSDLAFYAPWFELYWPGMAGDLAQHFTHEGVVAQAWGSWLLVAGKVPVENDTPEEARLLAAYSFDGRRLGADEPLGPLQIAPSRLSGAEIERLYAMQLAAGFTVADSLSPWQGTPRGPVTTDPAVSHARYSPSFLLCRPLDGLRR